MIIKSKSKQTTISKKVSLKGVGLHTGLDVELNFLPAEINNGYSFRRIDLEGSSYYKSRCQSCHKYSTRYLFRKKWSHHTNL